MTSDRLFFFHCTPGMKPNSTTITIFDATSVLPDDLLASILAFADTRERFAVLLHVCKRWHQVLTGHPLCWERIEMWKIMPLTRMLHSIVAQWSRPTPPPIKTITLNPRVSCRLECERQPVCQRLDHMDISPLFGCTQLGEIIWENVPCLATLSSLSRLSSLTSLTLHQGVFIRAPVDLSSFPCLQRLNVHCFRVRTMHLPTTIRMLNLDIVTFTHQNLDLSHLVNMTRLLLGDCRFKNRTRLVGLERLTRLEHISWSLHTRIVSGTILQLPVNPFSHLCFLTTVNLTNQPTLSAMLLRCISGLPLVVDVSISLKPNDMWLLAKMREVPSSCRLALSCSEATDQSIAELAHTSGESTSRPMFPHS